MPDAETPRVPPLDELEREHYEWLAVELARGVELAQIMGLGDGLVLELVAELREVILEVLARCP